MSLGQNRQAFNAVAHDYATGGLFPPERELLIRVRDRLGQMDVLDLGVGGGRTTDTFGALARSYVGVDYAENMVEACRARFGETPSQRFQCLDARDLSAFPDGSFDLVLFSFNGIDYVDLVDRARVLSEVKRVLRPQGLFLFSSHSLAALPWEPNYSGLSLIRPGAVLLRMRWFLFEQRRSWANRGIDFAEAKTRGWAYVQDGVHGFSITTFYGLPRFQVGQLGEAGLRTLAMYGVDGRELSPTDEPRDMMIHYLCAHAEEAAPSG